MAKDKQIWIQNAYTSDIEIILRDDKGLHDEHFIFRAYKLDRMTGQVISDGFTALEAEDYKRLEEKSRSLKKCIESGKLIKYDEPPASAMSTADRIIELQEKIRILTDENNALKAELGKYKKDNHDAPVDDEPKAPKAAKAKTNK